MVKTKWVLVSSWPQLVEMDFVPYLGRVLVRQVLYMPRSIGRYPAPDSFRKST